MSIHVKLAVSVIVRSVLYQIFMLDDFGQQGYGFVHTGILDNDSTGMNSLVFVSVCVCVCLNLNDNVHASTPRKSWF